VAIAARRPGHDLFWQVVGCTLLVPASATLIHHTSAPTTWTAALGAGGLVGAVLADALGRAFSYVGSFVLLIPVLIIGVMLGFGNEIAAIYRGGITILKVLWKISCIAARIFWIAISSAPGRSPSAEVGNTLGSPAAASGSADGDQPLVQRDVYAERHGIPRHGQWDHPDRELKIVRSDLEPSDAPDEFTHVITQIEPMPAPEPAKPHDNYEAADTQFSLPPLDLLDDPEPFDYSDHEQEVRDRALQLERTLAQFQMNVKVVRIDTGPVVTQYEIELEPGLRARKVMALADDLAIATRSPSVRVVAPIPGKNTVGIEVPNERRAKVGLKEVMQKAPAAAQNLRLPIFLGKDVKGQPFVFDLANMPHLLIAGRTGTGKSVCLNSLILSVLMTRTPDQVKLLMIDPKMVELSQYRDVPHLLHPVVTDMAKAEALLGWAVEKMEERYALLARAGVRHIEAYNRLTTSERYDRLGVTQGPETQGVPDYLPYILIFADEMADLMMMSAKEVECHIIRLAQKSRAVGIHLCLATQKPTVDVITGLIKSNLPARVAFQVASRSDSRVVLDEIGAEKLLGNGDMLFLYPGTSKIARAQGTYVSDEEVLRVTEFLCRQGPPEYSTELIQLRPTANKANDKANFAGRDDLYNQAVDIVVAEQRGSVSLLQRALGIGYGRAARLIDFMAEDGIVGNYNGSQARDVLYSPEEWEAMKRSRVDEESEVGRLSTAGA
jgi:DNA segregation ATPase FtsK/SpoIIIE-like protein